jgi:hypothetical protein
MWRCTQHHMRICATNTERADANMVDIVIQVRSNDSGACWYSYLWIYGFKMGYRRSSIVTKHQAGF